MQSVIMYNLSSRIRNSNPSSQSSLLLDTEDAIFEIKFSKYYPLTSENTNFQSFHEADIYSKL